MPSPAGSLADFQAPGGWPDTPETMNPILRYRSKPRCWAARFPGVVVLLLALLLPSARDVAAGTETNSNSRWPSLKEVLKQWDALPLESVQRAAESGELTAQHYLGYNYVEGVRWPRNVNLGITWYERALKNGYMPSANNLGNLYRAGRLVPQDLGRAVGYFKMAAEHGFALSMASLATMYYDGIGVPHDPTRALTLNRQAAEKGNGAAMYGLFQAYGHGAGVDRDEREALNWLAKAAEAGFPTAQCELGFRRQNPPAHQPRNMAEALRWYRLAADQNHAGGQYYLGLCYLEGAGVEFSEERALALMRLAADQDHHYAMVKLAEFYARGIGRTPQSR